ncbi:MAG: hypothetical protein WC866_02700 [Patescibacteria group bacterium]
MFATFVIFRISFLNEKITQSYDKAKGFLMLLDPGEEELLEKMSTREVLEKIKSALFKINHEFVESVPRPSYQSALLTLLANVSGQWRSDLSKKDRIYTFLEHHKNLMQSFYDRREKVFGYLIRNLVIVTVPISTSILLLPHYRGTLFNHFSSGTIVTLLSVCAVLSLAYSVWSVWKVSKV